MERRTVLKGILLGSTVAGSQSVSAARSSSAIGSISTESKTETQSVDVKDYLSKIKNFNQHFEEDVILTNHRLQLLKSVTNRLKRVRSIVGHANFCLLSFDHALLYARRYSKIGSFPNEEIAFLEEIFYTNANDYGFFGSKVTTNITSKISKREIKKIPYTGNYLFRDASVKLYQKIRRDIGKSLVLTSGVRGVVKQMYLFLAKSVRSGGNLSMASRSLAPPGHSFHGNGDFDVGKVGYGHRNFSEDFAKTREFKRLEELGYIRIRYHKQNPFGVRFEPWHVKVAI